MADLFRKTKSLFSTTSNSFGTGTGETITLNSVSGLPTDTEITLTFDRVDSSGTETPTKMERIIGTISGSNLVIRTSPSSGRGADGSTEQAHTSPVVEYIPNAKDINDMVDGILVEHDQDGTHGDITPTSVVTPDLEMTGTLDMDGEKIDLDADADTSIHVSTDDQIDFEVGGTDAFVMKAADFDLGGTTPNITVGAADPNRTITLMPGLLKPTTTSGCASSTTNEAATNDIDYDTLDFDASSDEFAFCNIQMPDSWDAGVIQFRVVWSNAGGGSAETVDWTLQGRSFADDDAIDQANGTAVTVTDTWIAQNDIHISSWSSDVTLGGTPAAGELVHLEIGRDVSGDNLTGDAQLIAVQIRYKQAQYSD